MVYITIPCHHSFFSWREKTSGNDNVQSSPSKSILKKRERKSCQPASNRNVVRKLYTDESINTDMHEEIPEMSDSEEMNRQIRLKENKKDVDEIEFYDNGLQYFESISTKGYGHEDVLSLLIRPDINRASLKQPLHVRKNATFLVRLKSKGTADRDL